MSNPTTVYVTYTPDCPLREVSVTMPDASLEDVAWLVRTLARVAWPPAPAVRDPLATDTRVHVVTT